MEYKLSHIPERTSKPRQNGLTMVMDKGLSLRQSEDLIESSSEFLDIVKLGFGTAYITSKLHEKIQLYKSAGIKVHLGGTLFEIFYVRDNVDDFYRLIDKYKLDTIEISDGAVKIEHEEKCEIIHHLSKNFNVLSEVGSKSAGVKLSPEKWTGMMQCELKAGSWKVIAEARESGTVGIYGPDGKEDSKLIESICQKVDEKDIIWEAPKKNQQAYFIKLLGSNVNLGNISPFDVIALETLRLGLRGDTLFRFLPDSFNR